MKQFKLLLALGILLIISLTAWADIPNLINFQGILDSAGNPLANKTVSVEFRIYNALVGGTAYWSETQSVTTNAGGVFNVILGTSNPVPDSAFDDTIRYLGIKVGTDAEMSPRQQIVSNAYGYRVATLDGASGGNVTGELNVSGMSNKIRFHFNDLADFPSPTTYHGMFAHAHNQAGAYYAHAGLWVRLADSAHFHSSLSAPDFTPNPALSVDNDGKVGIGTTTPTAKLEVLNSVSSASTEQGVSGIVSNSSSGSAFGGIFTASSAGTGIKTGVRGNASSASSNPAYGVYGEADNSSTGDAYAGFFNVPFSGGSGTAYGVYASALTSEGYAGYFSGNAKVTDTLFASNVSSSSPLRLQTGGTTRMYLDDVSGNVGIGTTAPTDHKLEVVDQSSNSSLSQLLKLASLSTFAGGDARLSFSLRNGSGTDRVGEFIAQKTVGDNDGVNYLIRTNDNGTVVDAVTIEKNGNVGIGTTSPAALLHVNGTAGNPSGVWSTVSDERLKKNIKPLQSALDRVLKLRGVSFEWKNPEEQGGLQGPQMGFIAQEVKQVVPEWVSSTKNNYLMVTPRGINALLVEAIKEQQRTIQSLEEKLEKLEKKFSRFTRQTSGSEELGYREEE